MSDESSLEINHPSTPLLQCFYPKRQNLKNVKNLHLFLIVSKSESSPDEESDNEMFNCFGGSGDNISIDLHKG